MIFRLLCVALLGNLFVCSGYSQVRRNMSDKMMTEGQALSLIQSRYNTTPTGALVVALKLQPTAEMQKAAKESLAEARSKDIALYQDGLFVNLMRAGGYVVLQFSKQTNKATRLYIVTSGAAGEPVVQFKDIHGEMSRDEALMTIGKAVSFSRAFFDLPGSETEELLVKFGGPETATRGITDGKGYLALPEGVRRLATPKELLELTSLSSGLMLWTIRRALATPVYAANPVAGVQQANDELARLAGEFRASNGEKDAMDFVDHLVDLSSIQTRDELKMRLESLREFTSFMDEHSPVPVTSSAYRANVSVSSVPLEIVVEQDATRVYGVTTAPGLISGWTQPKSGELVLIALSVGE